MNAFKNILRYKPVLLAIAALTAMGAQALSIPDPIGFTVDTNSAAKEISGGPKMTPAVNKTSLEPALRCMDRLFSTYGIQGVPMMIEEIPDATRKVNVGAREMFMSATSRMTQRSRAIKLIPYQRDSVVFNDRKDFVENAQYVLQGSVTQLDESILKRQRDGGICLGALCIGAAESDAYSALGLDMNVIRTSDLTMVPGVTSKNSVIVVKHGAGADGELNMAKFGLNFNFTLARSEGQGQALRSLIELGSIELYGKLLRIPYWGCLGNDVSHPEVVAEVDDWWESMAADIPALVSWLQTQMKARGLYSGPLNGAASEDLLRAVQSYHQALGLPANGVVDATFFKAYLGADHSKLESSALAALESLPKAAPKVVQKPAPTPAALPSTQATAPQTAPVQQAVVSVKDHSGKTAGYVPGEKYEVDVSVTQAGYLYCYLVDEKQKHNQFFPNPGRPQARVEAGANMQFPGPYPFTLLASKSGKTESVTCGLSAKDLGSNPLNSASAGTVEDLKSKLVGLSGGSINFGVFDVTP